MNILPVTPYCCPVAIKYNSKTTISISTLSISTRSNRLQFGRRLIRNSIRTAADITSPELNFDLEEYVDSPDFIATTRARTDTDDNRYLPQTRTALATRKCQMGASLLPLPLKQMIRGDLSIPAEELEIVTALRTSRLKVKANEGCQTQRINERIANLDGYWRTSGSRRTPGPEPTGSKSTILRRSSATKPRTPNACTAMSACRLW